MKNSLVILSVMILFGCQQSADQPTEDDIVWRLPPTLGTSADNPELKAELEAVGESNRMTLKFRKPE